MKIKNYKIFGVTKNVLPKMIYNNTVIHNPDILIFDERYKLQCILELDGYSHKTPYGVRKTVKRNKNYSRTGIPFIIMDIDKLKRAGKNWFEYLDESLHSLNIFETICDKSK